MAKWVSEITLHHPIPVLQKLFPQRPRKKALQRDRAETSIGSKQPIPKSATARRPHLPYDPCERRPCPAEPTPKKQHTPRVPSPISPSACPQTNPSHSPFCKNSLPHAPPTSRHPSSSGTGPERALDRSNKFPKRGSAKPHLPYDPCECRPCPAEPPPRRSTPPKVPFPTRSPKSLSPTKPSRFCKSSLPLAPPRQTGLQRDRAGASIGSKHPIPTARQREAPPPVRSLRAQALSRGAHPRSAPPC